MAAGRGALWRRGVAVVAAVAIAGCGSRAHVVAKELRYDGRTELDGGEKAASLALTGGAFAVLSVWAWKKNRKEDELENVRIKDEVERLEKIRAEFLDVEDGDESLDDDDLQAALNKRISEDAEDADADGESVGVAEGEREGGAEGEGEGESDGDGSDVSDPTRAEASDVDAAPDAGEGTAGEDASDADLDVLRRMWEATDDDKKGDKPGSGEPAL